MEAWIVWTAAGFGVIFGIFAAAIVFSFLLDGWYAGSLREDRSDPDNSPYYFMEISPGRANKLSKNHKILLTVKRENYIK